MFNDQSGAESEQEEKTCGAERGAPAWGGFRVLPVTVHRPLKDLYPFLGL